VRSRAVYGYWRAGLIFMAACAIVGLAGPAGEARVKIPRISSLPKPHSVPVPNPHVPSAPSKPVHMPAAPKPAINLSTAKGAPSAATGAPASRGFFRRTWDWVLGSPAPAPAAQTPTPAPAASAAPAGQAAGAQQDKDQRRASAPGAPSATAAAAGATGSANLAAALDQFSAKWQPDAGRGKENPGQGSPARNEAETAKPAGYILHLTNGRSLSVAGYEEKGDQIQIAQWQGTFAFPKSLVARIEERAP
jgi:hypothetical protein